MRFIYKLLFLLLTLINLELELVAQKNNDKFEILKAIEKYSECNSLCFEKNLIVSDSETNLIIKNISLNKRQFRKTLSNLNKPIPNLSKYQLKISNDVYDTSWNNLVRRWSSNIVEKNSNCQYKLSIRSPIVLSSDNHLLVIITAFKYEPENYLYDALVFFYNLQRIDEKWIITGSDHVYDLMYDWKEIKK